MRHIIGSSRHRRHQAKDRAVASAIGVLFIILIVVAGINTYLVTTLPEQMTVLEQQHLLAVENAFVNLQSDILAEAASPNLHVSVNTPLPMQSDSEPPFGAPAPSVLSANPTTSATGNFSYKIGTVEYLPESWNGPVPSCTKGTGSNISFSCSGTGSGVIEYNVSGNHTTLAITINGCGSSGCQIIYNITGSNDTINIVLKGNNVGNVTVILEGSNDIMNFSYGGSSVSHRYVGIWIYGEYDTYNPTVTGFSSGSKGSGLNVNTTFVGWNGGLCPATTLSTTDTYGPLVLSNSKNIFQNYTWWNDVGYVTPFNRTSIGTNDWEGFQNASGFISCAFTVVNGATYGEAALSGLFDNLNNRYYPAETVGFEEGAVVVGTSAYSSTMVSPPLLSLERTATGLVIKITEIQLIPTGNLKQSGGGVTSIQTHLLGVSHFTYINTPASLTGKSPFLVSPFYLNVTTLYPGGWLTYLTQDYKFIAGGAYAYYAPQNGYATYNVVIPFDAVGFDVTVITAGVSFS